jgi:dTDP-4-dehydrorhamnose reductase
LLHLSTDYVFDGKKNTPYVETDLPAPLSVYGLSKFRGEQELIKHHPHHILLRVSGVFSPWRHNFVKSILKASRESKQLKVVNDQQCCPTGAGDIARVILAIIKQLNCGANAWGIYHYVAADVMTWHGFAQAIVHEAKKYISLEVEEIIAISSSDYATRAPRPANSVLDCQKILNTFGIQQRSWDEELSSVIKQLVTENSL